MGERITSGKLPRQDKPSLLPRTFPRLTKARLGGILPAESTAMAVNRDIKALGSLQLWLPKLHCPPLVASSGCGGQRGPNPGREPIQPVRALPAHSGLRDPLAWDSGPNSAGLFPSESPPPGPVWSPLQASTCPELLFLRLKLQLGEKQCSDYKQKPQTQCSTCH